MAGGEGESCFISGSIWCEMSDVDEVTSVKSESIRERGE